MTATAGANREFEAQMDKIKMSIIDIKRALRNMRDSNDYTERVESLENTLDEIPTSNGALPTEQEHSESLNGETLLDSLEELSGEVAEIKNQDNYDPEKINRTLEKAENIQNEIQDLVNSTSAF